MVKKKEGPPLAQVPCAICGETITLIEYGNHIRDKHAAQAQPPTSQPVASTAPSPTPPQTSSAPPQGNVNIPPPEQPKFLNMARLAELGWKHESLVRAVRQGGGNFGPGFNLVLESGFTVTVKQNSQNHVDLYKAFGPNWVGRKVVIQPGTTPRGSARIAVSPG